ncbi:DUF6658 family protein [Chlorogloeopsis fritschii PCC 9212]|uniref:Uncharacterized protein n=1 Tax=Chlorogloeopsis fritschii PCC 6912 TaxID=211165 RepID=A0A433NHC0_CHLFR|nr:DUF6658 family protein [Chlorogloeopsis fritschii]RUR81780.1 hypothetical protein PCC6912_26490 [Chlorogloeopsis fritschii PCC 6912]
MNKVITWIKKVNLRQILLVFVAGILLFFTQACNSAGATLPGQNGVQPRQASQPGVRPNSELYVPKGDNVLNPPEGGMNNFSDSDVDPRSKGAASQAKARAEFLKENSEQLQSERQSSNPSELVRRVGSDAGKLGRNIQQKAEDVGEKAQGTAEDFARGTRKGLENIKENAQDAGSYAKEVGRDTVGNPRS